MSTAAQYYQKSGKTSPMAYVYALLIALIAAPILAAIYTLAIWHIPFIYINFLLAGGFGFLLGVLIKMFVINKGKVRSGAIAFGLSIFVGLAALYIHWAMWSDIVLNVSSTGSGMFNIGETFSMMSQPAGLFSFIGEINNVGTWGFGDTAVSGTLLTVVWVIEAILIAGVAAVIPLGDTDEPFCEINQEWFDSKTLAPFAPFTVPAELKTSLENNDMTQLNELVGQADAEKSSFSKLTLYANATNENYLTISNMVSKVDDDGKYSHEEEVLIKNLKITEEVSNMLEAKIDNTTLSEV